jgi:hypothetical protein
MPHPLATDELHQLCLGNVGIPYQSRYNSMTEIFKRLMSYRFRDLHILVDGVGWQTIRENVYCGYDLL